ncbi:questin oxidase family protein [Massilia sp. R2A-15]|uniref:questin oxidase family protein n=1 Tax=Massilia sp. R2A-15 TaxID=3064278 RepID=UPI002737144A|nr:questin oxidase family protein [Massilia sp. R2A-15]WLI91633.1 questin oxidase family protein [Massilia sp. R2A-15]
MKNLRTGAILHELLDANAAFALNAKGTTNHCPMALCALADMGASDERLREFFGMWRDRYAIAAPEATQRIERADWQTWLENPDAFRALSDCFAEWIGADGIDAVVRAVLGAQPFAPATGAFHAIIRLVYALEAGHAGEAAASLSAYVSGYLTVDIASMASASSVDAALECLSQAMQGKSYAGPSITARLRNVAQDPEFSAALTAPPSSALLDEMARAAIEIYWQTSDFTALHLVTGMAAARSIGGLLPADAVEKTWAAFCAAYVSFGAPPLQAPRDIDGSGSWEEFAAAAIRSDNDHVIKLVHVCRREAERTGSPLYGAAATRSLRL